MFCIVLYGTIFYLAEEIMNEYFDKTTAMDYSSLRKALERIEEDFSCVHCFSIGKSVLKRRIDTAILGSGTKPILFVGAHHSMEYITSMILVEFIIDLCKAFENGEKICGCDIKDLFRKQSIYIIPMLNPDGVELHLNGIESLKTGSYSKQVEEKLLKASNGSFKKWQANAHGVDLNHNYNADFKKLRQLEIESGINTPCETRYGGKRAESEPESNALCNLCRRIMFKSVYAFHSQGEEIFWDYGENTPECSKKIATELAAVSGYKVSKPEGLASCGGFKDWFIDVFKRPGFTIEVGKGTNPLPLSNFDDIYEKCKKLMIEALCK